MRDLQMKSNTMNQLNQTTGECESRITLIELKEVELVGGKRVCVKNVFRLKANINATKKIIFIDQSF